MSLNKPHSIPDYLKFNLSDDGDMSESDLRLVERIWQKSDGFEYPKTNVEGQWKHLKSRISDEKVLLKTSGNTKYHMFRWVAAAIIVLVCGIGVFQSVFKQSPLENLMTMEATKTFTLPDGSLVVLNQNTELDYSLFTEKSRTLSLLKGEAFFKVRHGKSPFVVQTTNGKILVHGTEFNVSSYEGKAYSVFLKKGKIEWTNGGVNKMMQAGELLAKNKDGQIEVKKVNNNHSTFWLDHKLVFDNSNLLEVIAVLEAHYQVKFNYDEQLNLEKITFSCNDLTAEQVAELLSRTLESKISVQ